MMRAQRELLALLSQARPPKNPAEKPRVKLPHLRRVFSLR